MNTGFDQSVAPAAPGNSSVRATVEALFRHRTAFLVTVGVVVALTVLITVLTPRAYQSEMNILVRNARPDYLISPERSNGQILQRDVTEERINSEIEVLRSKDVADAVVDPAWAAQPQHTDQQVRAHEKAVLEYNRHLTVEALRKSNVIHVAYLAGSPQEATATVDRLLKAFLAKQREIERSTGASAFFAGEADRYKQQLDEAQRQLADYQQTRQIVSLGTRETTLEAQINALDDAVRATQVQLTEAGNRVGSDRRQLGQMPERVSTQQRTVYNLQAVEQLTGELTQLQNKRTGLLSRYQPTDRLVTEVNDQIATTSAALERARTTNGQEATTDVNPVHQQVKAGLAASETDLAALRGRLADQTAQRDRLRAQLSGVEGSTVDFTTLQTRVAELQNNYQLYSQKKNEAEIADAMDQQQLVNVAVAERPTFAAKPYRPQVLLNLVLGSFTALFLGCAVVFFAELGRETVAAPYELEAISGAPVLATVPCGPAMFLPRDPSGGGGRRVAPEPARAVPREIPVAQFVAVPDSPEEPAAAPDEDRMKFNLFSSSSAAESQPAAEPAPSSAIVIHPLRPAVAARSYEQLATARMQRERAGLASEPVRPRDPRAYPSAPPRLEGAVKRTYNVESEAPAASSAPDPRHRAPLSLRSASMRAQGGLQRAHGPFTSSASASRSKSMRTILPAARSRGPRPISEPLTSTSIAGAAPNCDCCAGRSSAIRDALHGERPQPTAPTSKPKSGNSES